MEKLIRTFIPDNLSFEWDEIKVYYDDLLSRKIDSLENLKLWLKDKSELSAVLEEEFAWRYIRMNIDTTDQGYQKAFYFFVQEIQPKIAPYENKLNEKLVHSEFASQLNEKRFEILIRSVNTQLEIFREKNIPLFTELEKKSQEYGTISARMSINFKGKEYTLQEAAKFLKSTDREIRKEVFELINKRRTEDRVPLNDLYDQLIETRQEVAANANFENYRDYMFKAMGRFDYKPSDCFNFHQSIKKSVVPLLDEIDERRREMLGLKELMPWDVSVDISGRQALNPFAKEIELIEKTITCFNNIDPFFGDCIEKMHNEKHLDLTSKKGKAPGGFNYPLYESGYPFIFMNAVGTARDVTTIVHEGGHAIHSILTHSLDLVEFKNLTSEIAELASMSMELISMDHWEIFYPNEEDLKRAKRDQLIDILNTLPWVATIDKFQHWVYTHKDHKQEERYNYWEDLMDEFGSSIINWDGFEEVKRNLWQKQLHLYEVPFYYIEYGMAQLGAIAMWRNYRENPKKTIDNYKTALSLGYTRTIPEIYQVAGIQFDFSEAYVEELSKFIYSEILKTF